MVFALLQLVIVLVLHWALYRWHRGPGRALSHTQEKGPRGTGRERSPRAVHAVPILVGLGFVAWYLLLRTRPAAMGGDPFAFTLGVFDGISLAGITSLALMHLVLTRDSGHGGTDTPTTESG